MRLSEAVLLLLLGGCVSAEFAPAPGRPQDMSAYQANLACAYTFDGAREAMNRDAIQNGGGIMGAAAARSDRGDMWQEAEWNYRGCMAAHGWVKSGA